MARNIEIKARVDAWDRLVAAVQALVGEPSAVLQQRDTYFCCTRGRLKLREFDNSSEGARPAELIFYRRPDTEAPALSDYLKLDVPEAAAMVRLLTDAYGQRLVVAKTRWLYWHDATRIHLDRVESLGDFMELEVTLADGETEAHGRMRAHALMRALEIPSASLEARGYADLLAGA